MLLLLLLELLELELLAPEARHNEGSPNAANQREGQRLEKRQCTSQSRMLSRKSLSEADSSEGQAPSNNPSRSTKFGGIFRAGGSACALAFAFAFACAASEGRRSDTVDDGTDDEDFVSFVSCLTTGPRLLNCS